MKNLTWHKFPRGKKFWMSNYSKQFKIQVKVQIFCWFFEIFLPFLVWYIKKRTGRGFLFPRVVKIDVRPLRIFSPKVKFINR